jgi:hypothetical protein
VTHARTASSNSSSCTCALPTAQCKRAMTSLLEFCSPKPVEAVMMLMLLLVLLED